MPSCRYFPALYSRNAGCDLTSFSHKEVPHLQKTPRRVTCNRMQTFHPNYSFLSVTDISLIARIWALDIIPAFSEGVELQIFFKHLGLTFAKYFLDLLSF